MIRSIFPMPHVIHMSFRRSLPFPGKRKRRLRELDELIDAISGALTSLLKRSKKCEESWGAGFITNGELIDVWDQPHQNGSYLDQFTALLGLHKRGKDHLRNHFLKSISTLILSRLFKWGFDWKEILRENSTFGDRSLPVTENDHITLSFLNPTQRRLFAQWQYAFLPYSIQEMEAREHRNDVEPEISDQYRLPFYGIGKPLTYPDNMKLTREEIPMGLLVFKDGSTSKQAEFKDVKTFAWFDRPQFVTECRTQSFLKGSENLHLNIFLCFSYVSITNGPAFIIMDPASCNLQELLYGKEEPPAERLLDKPFSMVHDALGVASALKWLHSSIRMNDRRTPKCMHMDLRPDNILVFFNEEPGTRWKISNFGMSVWSQGPQPAPESSESWATTARQEPSDYQAPEVKFTPNLVGYSNDVWSFGCILMEVLAFVKEGPPKVKELQGVRNETRYFNTCWYEDGGTDHSLRATIRNWLIGIFGEDASPWQRGLRDLTFDILQGREHRRPSASEVHGRLRNIIERSEDVRLACRGIQHGERLASAFCGIQHSENVELVSRGVQHSENVELISRGVQHSGKAGLDPRGIQIKIMRWLDSCEGSTREQIQDGTTSILELYEGLQLHSRVIDVFRLRVVPAPKRCRYVALSYVWGDRQGLTLCESNEESLRDEGTLEPKKCSKTIQDAILLCQEIRQRYLWVDALCIVQDTKDKHDQILAMEAIYRGAVFTIVAAAGAYAQAGLPGVSDTPRRLPNFANPNSFDAVVNSSIWNTRAWTYQERILSQRLVVFTTEQIFFQCGHGRACEADGHNPHNALLLHRNTQPPRLDSYKLELECNINFNTYAQLTQEYSKRFLTRGDDIENAFEGIKKILLMLFSSEIIFCVPIAALDISLLWYPSHNLLQRRCVEGADDELQSRFPSWSWAGWVGAVYYKDLVNISERTVSCVKWRDPEKFSLLCTSGFGKNTPFWPRHDDWLRRVTSERRPYYIRRNGNPSHWFCHPISRSIYDPDPVDRKTGHLHFFADKVQSAPWRMKDPKSPGSNCLRIFHHTTGSQLGKVTMHMRYDHREKYEFLKMSSTTLTDGEKDPAWNIAKAEFAGDPGDRAWNRFNMDTSSASDWFDPAAYDPTVCFCLYNVLVTVTRGEISYRVGIGKIHIHAFDEVAIRDQLVYLG